MKRSETQGTILGYLGGNLIWCGSFEWSWRYFGHSLGIQPVLDGGFVILSSELLLIQATTLIVVSLLIFLGANKDTRCRMFMWFHRTFNLRPDSMTPGFKRQHARNTAMESVFLIWTIYLFAIYINDPRGNPLRLFCRHVDHGWHPGVGYLSRDKPAEAAGFWAPPSVMRLQPEVFFGCLSRLSRAGGYTRRSGSNRLSMRSSS